MIHVEKIEIINNTYPSNVLKKNFVVKCESVNLFVGNQGCGKSTLLNLLRLNHSDIALKLTENALLNGVDTFYFDTENDNPRTKDPQLFTKTNGDDIGIGYAGAIMTRFRSHGEVLERFIFNPLSSAQNCVIIIDEPEAGLSVTNQLKLIKAISTAVQNNCQLFIATHCYPLIMNFNVISLEHYVKMKGSDFIKLVS